MRVRDAIAEKLTKAFSPERLAVTDESHKHKGHGGWRPEGEPHFRVSIVAAGISGKTKPHRQPVPKHFVPDLGDREARILPFQRIPLPQHFKDADGGHGERQEP